MMSTEYTPEKRDALADYLATHPIAKGIGTEESACSLAAINLALTGKLTDDIPDCMSLVLGRATIILQDAMPDDMRNSEHYRAWLVTAPGTGRDREKERLGVILDWMWGTVLPQVQPVADQGGFGVEWARMCEERSCNAAGAAACAAAGAAARAARAVGGTFWTTVDPIGVLERMTYLDATDQAS